ncbi:hypothetical protein HNP33_003949 [Comamonas odontotermitis]|uniref:Exotoxin A catalytic domain-containing protein n=1 Tax=Comamonas odontotermitis TaxID=379895 RepID=A0ABR6RKY0_9BURK|nr:hypothetical protein [Comamonas odontotermitis]MBB6579833.1 hypothetical protein [Comamonas odontotermitis]
MNSSSVNGLRRTAPAALSHREADATNVATQAGRQRNSGPLSTLSTRSGQEAGLRLANLRLRAQVPTSLQAHADQPWMTQAVGLPAPTGPNPHTAPHATGLLRHDPAPQSVQDAHKSLQDAGYQFVGYHGTNHASFTSMFNEGLDASHLGSNSGTAKGSGLYVSHQPGYAKDWAEAATQTDEDPQPPKWETPLKAGDAGVKRVTRVYVKNIETMQLGRNVAWGMHPSAGDPNDDKRVQSGDTSDVEKKIRDLEMVFSPHAYQNLAVIPSLGDEGDAAWLGGQRAKWSSHEDPVS